MTFHANYLLQAIYMKCQALFYEIKIDNIFQNASIHSTQPPSIFSVLCVVISLTNVLTPYHQETVPSDVQGKIICIVEHCWKAFCCPLFQSVCYLGILVSEQRNLLKTEWTHKLIRLLFLKRHKYDYFWCDSLKIIQMWHCRRYTYHLIQTCHALYWNHRLWFGRCIFKRNKTINLIATVQVPH